MQRKSWNIIVLGSVVFIPVLLISVCLKGGQEAQSTSPEVDGNKIELWQPMPAKS